MKHLNNYKIFESKENLDDVVIYLEDIFLEVKDMGFMVYVKKNNIVDLPKIQIGIFPNKRYLSIRQIYDSLLFAIRYINSINGSLFKIQMYGIASSEIITIKERRWELMLRELFLYDKDKLQSIYIDFSF